MGPERLLNVALNIRGRMDDIERPLIELLCGDGGLVRRVVTGEKKSQSIGTQIYLTGATVFKTEKKKSDTITLLLK